MSQVLSKKASQAVHPARSPRQKRWVRRLNNYSIYRTVRKAIRECGAEQPILLAPCGYGWFFERYQRDGIQIAGIDIDPETVAHARTAVSPSPRVEEGDLLKMPFKDGEFDFVVNNRFMPHFDAEFRAKAFKELARVTRRYLLVHYDYPVSVRQMLHRVRGFKKDTRAVEKMETWHKTQRRDRKELFTREMMANEAAPYGLRVKQLYFVCYLISDRVYCLYEKTKAEA